MARILLREILQSYSAGELAHFIGVQTISEFEKLKEREISTQELAEAVFNLYGYEIVANEVLRKKLIERMSQSQVETILENLTANREVSESSKVQVDVYEALTRIANRWPESFISEMGFYSKLELSAITSQRVSGIARVDCGYPLYPYQQDMVLKINRMMNSGIDRKCLLHLPTGAGKTRTAVNIACEHLRQNPKGLVLWLADTAELCKQASDEFYKAWGYLGNRTLKEYLYFSDTNISLGGVDSGFLVAGLQKLNSTRGSDNYKILYEKLRQYVSLIIFDEAHKAIAPTYALTVGDMLSHENETFLLGLTATPGRKLEDNSDEDHRLSSFFDNKKITMKISGYESPIKYLVEKGYLAKAKFKSINYDGKKVVVTDAFANQKRTNEIRLALSEDENRNLQLLDVLIREHNKGSSIIVFACSIQHSIKLASLLAISGIKAYSLDSQHDSDETRRYKIAEYSQGHVRILINYNILTAGFDAPVTNVAIIARPTDSLVQYSQMAGRAMRGELSGGNRECTIYTVRDDIPAFRSVAEAFVHWDRLWTEV